jgi:hypothetical protein
MFHSSSEETTEATARYLPFVDPAEPLVDRSAPRHGAPQKHLVCGRPLYVVNRERVDFRFGGYKPQPQFTERR